MYNLFHVASSIVHY